MYKIIHYLLHPTHIFKEMNLPQTRKIGKIQISQPLNSK
jgi:hypothetical protein